MSPFPYLAPMFTCIPREGLHDLRDSQFQRGMYGPLILYRTYVEDRMGRAKPIFRIEDIEECD